MSPRLPARPPRLLAVAAAFLTATALVAVGPLTTSASAANPVSPGDFTGYAFDQCNAPSTASMDTWMQTSPYRGVGIYISGDSRACKTQANLNPDWISHQQAAGWRLLPLTVGPQAGCNTRYNAQPRIDVTSTGNYANALAQGKAEADKTVAAATALGIAVGSTMWYDLEAYNIKDIGCRESALQFLSGWTQELHAQGWASGVYSSAASGIKALSDALQTRPTAFVYPDQIWVADWNGVATTHTDYIPDTVWGSRQRIHQYKGGHKATYGGVTINIDSNWMDLGPVTTVTNAAQVCTTVDPNLRKYPNLGGTARPTATKVLQCLLTQQGLYNAPITGAYDATTIAAVRAYRARYRFAATNDWNRAQWISLLAKGTSQPYIGKRWHSDALRQVQRAITASKAAKALVTGRNGKSTQVAIRAYQRAVGLKPTGIVNKKLWKKLNAGRY